MTGISRRRILGTGAAFGALAVFKNHPVLAQAAPRGGVSDNVGEGDAGWAKMYDFESRVQTMGEVLPQLPAGRAPRVLFINVRGGGWLEPLARWAGPNGSVTATSFGTDSRGEKWQTGVVKRIVDQANLSNLTFKTAEVAEAEGPYDLVIAVRAMYKVQPDQWGQILDRAIKAVRPGGNVMVVEYDYRTWHNSPPAPALDWLHKELPGQASKASGYDFSVDRLPALFTERGLKPIVHANMVMLPPGGMLSDKSYLSSGTQREISKYMRKVYGDEKVEEMRALAKAEAYDPLRWVSSPLVVSVWAQVPGVS